MGGTPDATPAASPTPSGSTPSASPTGTTPTTGILRPIPPRGSETEPPEAVPSASPSESAEDTTYSPTTEVGGSDVKCEVLGYDFGFKTPDPGCEDKLSATSFNSGYLELTHARGGEPKCDFDNLGTYTMDCTMEDGNSGQFLSVVITPSVDVTVIIKAGREGDFFDLKAGETYTLSPEN
jgi:hypothetical protein